MDVEKEDIAGLLGYPPAGLSPEQAAARVRKAYAALSPHVWGVMQLHGLIARNARSAGVSERELADAAGLTAVLEAAYARWGGSIRWRDEP